MWIDAHAHLDKYQNLLEPALEEINECRIFTISNSMDLPSYERNLEIGAISDLVLPTFGIHPKRAPEYADRLLELGQAIERTPLIGEIGLDFRWVEDSSQYPAQRKVFEYFLAAAREQKKIVNLHTKGAEKEILDLLERYDIHRPIVHWYSGPLDILRAMIDYRACFTIGVELMYSEHIQAITRELPMTLLLTETDNPGGLQWLAGKPGMPSVLRDVLQAIAELKQTTAEAVVDAVQENFLRLIHDDPWLDGIAKALE